VARTKDTSLHEKRRRQIIEASKACFIENGFHKTSMRQILQKADISAGAAYTYFRGKEEIINCMVDDERASMEEMGKHLSSSRDKLKGLVELVTYIIQNTDENKARLEAEVYAESLRNEVLAEKVKHNDMYIKDVFAKAINEGKKLGQINKTLSNELSAEWLLALLEGQIGRIAKLQNIKPKSVAKIAGKSVKKFLSTQ